MSLIWWYGVAQKKRYRYELLIFIISINHGEISRSLSYYNYCFDNFDYLYVMCLLILIITWIWDTLYPESPGYLNNNVVRILTMTWVCTRCAQLWFACTFWKIIICRRRNGTPLQNSLLSRLEFLLRAHKQLH